MRARWTARHRLQEHWRKKNLTCKSNDRICWYSFHVQSCSYCGVLPLQLCKLFLTDPSREAIGWCGEPIGGGAAGYLNSPLTAQLNQATSSDFSNIILLLSVSSSVPASTERKAKEAFFLTFFLPHQFYREWDSTAFLYIWEFTDAPVDWGKTRRV